MEDEPVRATKTVFMRTASGKVRWRLVDVLSGSVLVQGEARNHYHAKLDCSRLREQLKKG